jgi:mannose-6-phosphate isomerase-like protein (cupin superfamily)
LVQILKQAEARRLGLPGRSSIEIVSKEKGSQSVTLRLVEVPPARPGDPLRQPHYHLGFEECIFVMAGEGCTEADSGVFPVRTGDTVLIPSGERHVTRNTGTTPLVLLCFFPVSDISSGTCEAKDKVV